MSWLPGARAKAGNALAASSLLVKKTGHLPAHLIPALVLSRRLVPGKPRTSHFFTFLFFSKSTHIYNVTGFTWWLRW